MGAHGGHVFRITQNEPTSYPSYTVNGYDYADFNNPETGETEPPDVYCVTCGEMAYGYSLNWGEEDESGNPRIVPDQTAADPGTWQELSHAAVGDRVFIARHDGTEQEQGMPGLWATVLSTVDAASAGAAAIAFLDTLGYQVVEHVPIPLSGLTCTWDGCGSAEVYGPDQDGQYECHTCFAEHTRETLTQRS